MGSKPQVDSQALVAEYPFFFAKNGVSEFGRKLGEATGAAWVRLDEMDSDRVIGIGDPYSR